VHSFEACARFFVNMNAATHVTCR